VTEKTRSEDSHGYVESHPAFGTVALSRVHWGMGGARLFQSQVLSPTTMRLTIRRAQRRHGLSQDWVHGNEELCEVEMSPAQFVEFITTPNMGTGVPCTIRFVRGEGHTEDLPDDPTENERVRESFKEHMQGLNEKLAGLTAAVDALLDDRPTKANKQAIRDLVTQIRNDVTSDVPFIAGQFQESVDRTVTQAKAEIDAFTTLAVQRAGLEAIAGGTVNLATLLGTGDDERPAPDAVELEP
jgi:hypothetical protein